MEIFYEAAKRGRGELLPLRPTNVGLYQIGILMTVVRARLQVVGFRNSNIDHQF